MDRINLLYALESAGGGTLKHVVYLATRLIEYEFVVTVVLPDEDYEKDTRAAVLLMRKKGICVDVIPMAKPISPIKDVITLFKIYAYLKKHQFDIVHAHSSKAGALFRIAAQWANIPVVYTPHCFYFTAYSGLKRRLFAGIERILAKRTQAIVISGTEQTAIHGARIKPKKRIAVINNAIDPEEYKSTVSNRLNVPKSHTVVIGVGRLVKQKDWDTFLKMAKGVLQQYTEITFLIAGEGPCHKHLSDLIDQWKLSSNVKLCGHLDDISEIYSIADIFVSTSKWEGLPYTYLEALHFQIPMLVTYTEGMEYFSKTYCIQPDDYESLSHKILDMVSGTHQNQSYDTSLYSIEEFISQHRDLYNQLLSISST